MNTYSNAAIFRRVCYERMETMTEKRTMKALVMRAPGQYGVEQVPVPECGEDEVMIRMEAVAICGSDPVLLDGGSLSDGLPRYLPFIPGHEGAGTIVECGAKVNGFQPGDRVAIESHLGCGYCENCKAGRYNLCLHFGDVDAGHKQYGFTVPGCYAEYFVCKPRAIHKIPDNLSFDHAALTDTVATAYHLLERTGVVSGGWSLIVGCGPVGMAMLMLCRAMGSRAIVVDTGERLNKALELGAEYIFDFMKEDAAAAVQKVTGVGVDRSFDCAGNAASMKLALAATRRGGTVGLVAIPKKHEMEIDLKTIVWDEKKLVGSRGNPNCHAHVLAMMAGNLIPAEKMITHHFPLDQIQEAVSLFQQRLDGVIKVIITF